MKVQPMKDFMHAWLCQVLHEVGPRESCSEAEKKAGRIVADVFRESCDQVLIEPFSCHPKAFLGVFPFFPLFYLLTLVCYWWLPALAWIPMLAGTLLIGMEVVRYKEFADRLFPKAEGENVIGIIKPEGEIRRRVVVCAHLDSAYEFNWFLILKDLATPTAAVAAFSVLFMLVLTIVRFLGEVFGFSGASFFEPMGWVAMAFFPVISLFFFWHTYVPVPGAMDNLAGIAVLVGLARNMQALRTSGEQPLKHTELVLLASSSEEAGLRGAKRFVTRHLEGMRRIPTEALIIDNIYDERLLTVFSRELFTGARADPRLYSFGKEVASEGGWKLNYVPLAIGATDASAFTQAGIPAISLVLSDTSTIPMQYHTRYDTPDRVRPESLEVALLMVAGILQKVDDA